MEKTLQKKTKIVATIGPVTESPKQLEKLFKAGVNVVRMNFSHNTHEWHQQVLDNARNVSEKIDKPIAILQDLAGPKIRTGDLIESKVKLVPGKKITLTTKTLIGNHEIMSINYKKLPSEVKKGDILKLEDGKKELRVLKTTETEIFCVVVTGGMIGSRKGINVPGVDLSISSLTSKDKKDVLFGIKNKVDFIALSFVQNKNDILGLRKILNKHKSNAHIIAKIETEAAVKNIDDIIAVSDGIMVARGDMAIEVGAERVPMIQKMIIDKCNELAKPVITATQMLDSMENSPVPTRAEVSDIANAILDGTDAIMLSGETTIGQYPIRAVETMTSIAQRTEPYSKNAGLEYTGIKAPVTDTLSHSAVRIANDTNAELIVVITDTGHMARMVSRYRPEQALVAIAQYPETQKRLALTYGCYSIYLNLENDISKITDEIRNLVIKNKWAKKGARVVIAAGSPFASQRSVNSILVIEI